ncbi:MAG: glycerate kinase [Chloroflexi bacterium]|nr:glycerate kinase [Chloroflexota bacterium]
MNFLSSSLQDPRVVRILQAAFDAADPSRAVREYLRAHPLTETQRIFVFGLGKAACAMVDGLTDLPNIADTLIVTKHAARVDRQPVTVMEGNHPVPGEASLAAGRAALEFVSRLTPDDLLLCLISGGGSALMTAPILPLTELQALTSTLLAKGARIDEINTLRRHLDLLKGGGLAQAAQGARVVSLILSDVVGDPLEAIASGPTAPDPSTRAQAEALAARFSRVRFPFRETLKTDDPLFTRVQNRVIASNDIALRAAQYQAEIEGFDAQVIASGLQGEAREVGRHLAEALREAAVSRARPFCLLAGGETTVTLHGSGRGGRNQELVLGAVESLRGLKDVLFISIATDGEDGPTDAAGAVATGETASRAGTLGVSAEAYLAKSNSYAYFAALDDLLRPGPSGTNVNDLMLLFGL